MRLTEVLADTSAHDENLIWVDHREEEEAIVGYVSSAIEGCGNLGSEWRDDAWLISYKGQSFKVPLTMSPHDRYVAIGSLAKVLESDYEFWIQTSSLDSDTHGLLLAERSEVQSLSTADREALNEAFTRLKLGHDYFSGLEVPYVGVEDANPNLMEQSAAQGKETKQLVDQVLSSPEAKGAVENMKTELARLFGLGRGKDKS